METPESVKLARELKAFLTDNLPRYQATPLTIGPSFESGATDDPGNEYLILIKLLPEDEEDSLFDYEPLINLRGLNNRLLEDELSQGDFHLEILDPILLNSTALLPIVLLK